jgi:hypothetical protein
MKNIFTIGAIAFVALVAAFTLTFCGGSGTTDALSNAPAGFTFTDTSGNTISTVARGTAVQLRDASGNVVLQFSTNGTVNFANLTAGRDTTKSLAHFPSSSDKSGLTGNLVLYTPCEATTTEVHVCPSSTSLTDTATGCTGEITLTQAAATSGNYTWDNATTRTGAEDCQVSAAVANFGTGAFGEATGQPVLTTEDFPTVGVCSTGTVDVTSDDFKNALAAATSFTFLHKPYATDADIPFICGKEGTWDPSEADAFDGENTLNMTDTIANLAAGAFGNVFICYDGFGFAGGSPDGFNDAGTYRGELKFTANSTTYRARFRFTVAGTGAGQTFPALGITSADVGMTDSTGSALTILGDVRDLFAASPTNITTNAVTNSTTQVTTTGGFICAGTE